MVLYRMMSLLEFRRLIRGDVLSNKTKQSSKYLSDASGFCFNDQSMIPDERRPFLRLTHLEKVVPELGVFVKVDIPDNHIKICTGKYVGYYYSREYREYCLEKYGIPLGTTVLGYRFYYKPWAELYPEFEYEDEAPVLLRPLDGTKNLIAARREVKKFSRSPERYQF